MNLKNKLFNSSLSIEDFQKKYWNKKPYLFKNAIKNTQDLGDVEDFFEMSFDPDFETRMVFETGGEYPWQAKLGPFKKKDFKKNALWTLICHNLELYNRELYEIREEVNFISNWHFDDVMATISKKGASVGAHIDDYSVFIFQGKGSRKWMVQTDANPDYLPDVDIKLLKEFTPTTEWILKPGDLLYLPPNLAHHGISLEDSISYSIGFKSIRYQKLLDTLISADEFNFDQFSYHDQKNKPITDRFIIPDYVISDLQKDLIKIISDKQLLKRAAGLHLSKPKNDIFPAEDLEEKEIIRLLKSKKIKRDIWAKLVSTTLNSKTMRVNLNNKEYFFPLNEYHAVKTLFEGTPHDSLKVNPALLKQKASLEFLVENIKSGVLYFDEGSR